MAHLLNEAEKTQFLEQGCPIPRELRRRQEQWPQGPPNHRSGQTHLAAQAGSSVLFLARKSCERGWSWRQPPYRGEQATKPAHWIGGSGEWSNARYGYETSRGDRFEVLRV